jgi:ATP-dependent DNA helicase RecG
LSSPTYLKKVPTAGGILLFGKEKLKIFPDAWIQVGRFAGITKTHIIDTQEITVYPILAIDEVIAFLKKHAMRGIKIKGSRHTETWSLSLTAIREAVINAIVHAN